MKLKSKLTIRFFIIGTLAVIFTTISCVTIFWNVFKNQVEKDLECYGKLAVALYVNTNDEEYLKETVESKYRITIINSEGKVIFETENIPLEEIENHSNRPEVIKAIETGEGVIGRQSQTLNEEVFYYAKLLPDNNVLRVSQKVDSYIVIFESVVIAVGVIALIILLFGLFISNRMTKSIVKPIENMIENNLETPYEELKPLSQKITEQNNKIKSQFEEIQQETNKINTLIANMAEGFILLDTNKKILMQNDSAVHLLYSYQQDMLGKNFVHITRNEKVDKCINTSLKGKSKIVDFKCKNKQLQLLANPVYSGNKQIGVICIIVDKTALKQIDKMKQEFTANVSHELKTPLTSISGYAEMIESGLAKDEDVKNFAHKIHKEAGRLVTLIGDIIQLSQLEEVATTNNIINVDLKEVAEECVDSLDMYASKHNVIIETSLKSNIVKGDRYMIYELIYNLTDNAIRYSKENGNVLVTVDDKNGEIYISVKDDGIGIPKEHQARIFERFYRVDKSRSKQTGGTGLGLAIVKHIAEQHNANIILNSDIGSGTEIIVMFKKASN